MFRQVVSQPPKQPRARIRTSCDPCHQRKVKCNRAQPCNQCVRHSIQSECQYSTRANRRSYGVTNGHTATDSPSTLSSLQSPQYHFPERDASHYVSSASADRSHAIQDSSESSNGLSNFALVHKWSGAGNVRGRTHLSWLVEKFDPLMSECNLRTSGTNPGSESRAYSETASETAARNELDRGTSINPQALFEELPDQETTEWLIERFFQTFGSVFGILHRPVFHDSLRRMLQNVGSVNVCFMVQLLLVLSLANATLPEDRAVFRRATVLGWLNLAEGMPQTAMGVRNFDIETVRMWALICLSEQIWVYDEFADYVFSGAAMRAGAALGLHHANTWSSDEGRQGLWEALVELDLQACLAAGMSPSVSPFIGKPSDSPVDENQFVSSHLASQTPMSDRAALLSASMDCRFRILRRLNNTSDFSLENALSLSKELTNAMRPVLEAGSRNEPTESFVHQFAVYVYAKFLAVLHRPFALMHSTAFHYSRNVALSLAQKNIDEITRLYTAPSEASAFECLQLGSGTFCRSQSTSSFMSLCWELKLSADKSDDLQLMSSWIGSSIGLSAQSSRICSKIRQLLPFVKRNIQDQDMAARAYVVGSMTVAHYEISDECEIGSDQYLRRMREISSDLTASLQGGTPG